MSRMRMVHTAGMPVQTRRLILIALASTLFGCGDESPSASPAADGGTDANSPRDSCVPRSAFRDADRDGYGDRAVSQEACSLPPGFVDNADDCDDECERCFPGANERCDSVDNDCDGTIDEGVLRAFHPDGDGDGYGGPDVTSLACSAPAGFVFDLTDCDDGCKTCHPGAPELCDGLDNGCEGLVDEGFAPSYADCDGDHFAPASAEIRNDCAMPTAGPAACPTGNWTSLAPVVSRIDCNDGLATVNPGNQEWHDAAIADSPGNYDWNCDGVEERGYTNVTSACLLSGTSCFGYWTSGALVDCGGSALFQDCVSTIVDAGLACVAMGVPFERAQVCR